MLSNENYDSLNGSINKTNTETPAVSINENPADLTTENTKESPIETISNKRAPCGYIKHDSGDYECKKCRGRFISKDKFIEHIDSYCKRVIGRVITKEFIVDNKDETECAVCYKKYPTARELFWHASFHEEITGLLYNAKLILNTEFVVNVTDELKNKGFACKFCDIELKKNDFISHVRGHLDQSESEHPNMLEANITEYKREFFLVGISASGNTFVLGRNDNGITVAMSINPYASSVFWKFRQKIEIVDNVENLECSGCCKKFNSPRKLFLHVVRHEEPKILLSNSVFFIKSGPIYICNISRDSEDALFECKFCVIGMERDEFFPHVEGHLKESKPLELNSQELESIETKQQIPMKTLWVGSSKDGKTFLLRRNVYGQAVVLALDFLRYICAFWLLRPNGDSLITTTIRPIPIDEAEANALSYLQRFVDTNTMNIQSPFLEVAMEQQSSDDSR